MNPSFGIILIVLFIIIHIVILATAVNVMDGILKELKKTNELLGQSRDKKQTP